MKTSEKTPLSGLKADYEIAKQNGRFRRQRRGVSGVGTSGDYHFRNESDWLYSIEYARDLDRNDGIAGMVVDRLLDNILQDRGIQPDPMTGDENANALLKELWWQWSTNEDACDLAGEMNFSQIERLVLRSTLVDGDIISIGTEAGSLETMEAHRCRTPSNSKKNIVFGVELDQYRKRERYYFTNEDVGLAPSIRRVKDTTPVDARDESGLRQVFHVFDPNRFSQTRGVSVFRRVADALGMHDDIQFANLVRQQIASCFAIIRNRKQSGPLTSGPGYGDRTTTQSGSYSKTTENISPGMEIGTEPGETIEGFSPNIPNPQFFEHVQLILKIVSANLGIPLHAVLLDASQTNFSGWRGAHDQARSGYRRIQQWLTDKFHQRVWRWKVSQWLAEYPQLQTWANQDGVDIFYTRWSRPSWEYVQPVQDAAADISKIRSLISTMRRVHGSRGDDFDEITTEAVNDNMALYRKCRDAARMLNEEAMDDSERVSWREMLALPTPEGISVSLSAAADPMPGDSNAAA